MREMLSARISAKLSSLLWRSLTGYGRIKYRYLLPVYRLLHVIPDTPRTLGTTQPSKTLRGAQAVVSILTRHGLDYYRNQLRQVIERVQTSNGAVIFLPSVGWNLVNTQRPHHLAREFTRQGYISIFDTTNQYDDVNGFKEVEPNLFLFRADPLLLAEIPDPILWSFTYNYDRTVAYPEGTRIVYDCIDDLTVFPYDREFLEANHARGLKEATVVSSVAGRLHEQALPARPDALYLPNGVDYPHFATAGPPITNDAGLARLMRENKPIAGYYGALAEWFDYELLESVARLRSDWSFLLIGPKYDLSLRTRGSSLLKLPNVRWIGHRKYELLGAYLHSFDVAMIPFVINDVTLATSPLKLYEYFAGGKPVVTTAMPECQLFSEVRIARDCHEFSRALDLAKNDGEDEDFVGRLQSLAKQNSWANRVTLVLEHLSRARAGGDIRSSRRSQ